ncbi:MAG TPA: hypothetical protein VMT56_00405 [Candidatus Bathyarchaeia archaeon]|nr:hypothetical protein [Candidatus Bathyarchaeia archaeon]
MTGLAAVVQGQCSGGYSVTRPPENWYVDSRNGYDSNSGLDPWQPLKSIGALLSRAPAAGAFIWLARGSYWREEIPKLSMNVTISAFGPSVSNPVDDLGRSLPSDRPMLDCSNIAPNSAFTQTLGYTYVYQITWASEFGSSKTAQRVWENGVRLIRAKSLANCDATPGSFYATNPSGTGSDIVWIHAADGSNPAMNGYVYELAARNYGINARDSHYVTVNSLATRRNGHNDGSLLSSYMANDCWAYDGQTHNFWVQGTAINCGVQYCEYPLGYGATTMFITFTDGTVGIPPGHTPGTVLYKGCQIIGEDRVLTGGYYVHCTGSAQFDRIIYDNCSAQDVNYAFEGVSATHVILYNCSCSGCQYAVGWGGGTTKTVYEIGCTWILNVIGRGWNGQDYGALLLYCFGCRFIVENATAIWAYYAQTYQIQNCTFYVTAGSGYPMILFPPSPGTALMLWSNNLVWMAPEVILDIYPGWTYQGDINDWFSTSHAPSMTYQGTVCTSLAAWQAATGQDPNAITTDPQFIGTPLTGDTRIATSSQAYTLNIGADVASVPAAADALYQMALSLAV